MISSRAVRPFQDRGTLVSGLRIGHPVGGPAVQHGQPEGGEGGVDLLAEAGAWLGHGDDEGGPGYALAGLLTRFDGFDDLGGGPHTSKALALAGIRTTSATRTASALILLIPGGPSRITQSYRPDSLRT